MTRRRGQANRIARNGTGDSAKSSARTDIRERSTAFDDDELRNWLMECIAEGSDIFLCAIAEAAVAALEEDYLVLRPALLELRRKHDTGYTI